jgi:hypothetical protein
MNEVRLGIKHAKWLTRQLEGGQVIQVGFVTTTPTKDIHNIVDNGNSMTFTMRRNASNTV